MKKILTAVLFIFTLGCSSLGAVSGITSMLGGGGGPSLDAEVTLGDKQEEVNVDVGKKVSNEQQAQVIYNSTEEFDPTVLIILVVIAILGWMLPTPKTMWDGLKFWKRK